MSTNRLNQLFELLKNSPNDAFLLFAIAKDYEGKKDLEKAKEYYLKLKQIHPEYVGTYYHLGKLFEKEEAFDQALSTYETGMEVAQKAGDKHAYGELRGAKEMLDEDF